MSKRVIILVIAMFIVLSLTSLNIVQAYITKPSVPEFTLQVNGDTIQITIQNQPAIPNGEVTANIFYDIRIKRHSSTDWVHTTVPDASKGTHGYIGEMDTSGSTVLIDSVSSINDLLGPSDDPQVDFQVEAINGYLNTTPRFSPPIGFDPNSQPVIIVSTSGWSNTQTVTISAQQTDASLFTAAVTAIVVTVAVAMPGLLLQRKKHREAKQT